MDQHTGGKRLIHGTKHHEDNQLQACNTPVEFPSLEYKFDIKESDSDMFNPIL